MDLAIFPGEWTGPFVHSTRMLYNIFQNRR
ncbi:hypothetical protein Pan110_23750 [Gimesia panareensis]|nr:hypothetical protein Pan110_23750 [Gimesia panareensis]